MKKFSLIICLVIATVFLSCFGCNTNKVHQKSIIDNGIELSVEPDEYWLGKMKIFIFNLDRTPQMAAWIENDQGDYISTIIVTNKNSRKKWISAPKEGRPEALPVWNSKIQGNKAQIDAVTAATSKGAVNVQIDNDSLTDGQEYNIYLEINHSFDYNNFWTESNSGVNGQPSLIYHAKFVAGTTGRIDLIPAGHGSIDGSNGNIVYDLDTLTTALAIINNACIMQK